MDILNCQLIRDLLEDKPFIRFVFDHKKILFEMSVTSYPNKRDIKCLTKLFIHIRKKLKIYNDISWECKEREDFHSLELNKEEVIYSSRNYHKKLGKYFNIPECCLKRYLREQKSSRITSYNSSKRYLDQCKKMKISDDKFRIKILHKEADCSEYGFVPCSPKCKEALRIAKITEEMQTKLMGSLGLK